MDNIICILNIFYLASGLKINISKSNLYGVGVSFEEIEDMAAAPEAVLKVLESLRLRVGSLKVFNSSLLLKWRWRLLKCPSALWVKVLKSIHGSEAGIDLKGCQTNGLWARIVGTIFHLHSSGFVPLNSLRFKVGDGSMVRFWKDTWLGDTPLCHRFNRLYRLEKNPNCFIINRIVNGLWKWD
ncbi:hypothetical protein Tco_0901408 [Tanacetum coccineum]